MAITDIGLSREDAKERGGEKRFRIGANDDPSRLYLKWRTASGPDMNASFDIALNYRVVPKVTVEGGGIGCWATDWGTWTNLNAEEDLSPTQDVEGWLWSYDLASLLGRCGIKSYLIGDDETFGFGPRYYDLIEIGVHIKSNYHSGLDEVIGAPGSDTHSPRTDTTLAIEYVPEYAITGIRCEGNAAVAIDYTCSSEWKRTDDRFCIERMRRATDGKELAPTRPWGTVARQGGAGGTMTVPISELADMPLGESLELDVRFNPSYGASGAEFARASKTCECQGGGANLPRLSATTEGGVLRITVTDAGGGKPIERALLKMVGSEYAFDQQAVEVGETSDWPYTPRGRRLEFKAYGVAADGTVSDVTGLTATVEPSAPVEVVSLRDAAKRAMARWNLALDYYETPSAETVKLAGRARPCTYYGEGGTAAWAASFDIVKAIAGPHDAEAAWREAAASGDAVLLLDDGRRAAVTIDALRTSAGGPRAVSAYASMTEVDA